MARSGVRAISTELPKDRQGSDPLPNLTDTKKPLATLPSGQEYTASRRSGTTRSGYNTPRACANSMRPQVSIGPYTPSGWSCQVPRIGHTRLSMLANVTFASDLSSFNVKSGGSWPIGIPMDGPSGAKVARGTSAT